MTAVRQRLAFALIFTLSGLAANNSLQAADGVLLKPKFDAAAQTYVEIDNHTTQKMTGPDGKPMEVKARSVFGLMEKASLKSDTVQLDMTLDRLIGAMSFGDAVKSFYDSDDPDFEDASPMHKDTFNPILNMPVSVTLNKEGIATSVVGGEPIRKKLVALGDQNFVAKSLVEGELSNAQVKSGLGEASTVLLPNREVKVGETWQQKRIDEYQQVGKVIVTYDCKLDRVEKTDSHEIAHISFKGKLAKEPTEKATKDHPIGKIDGSFTGTAKFDVALGRCTEVHRDTTAEIEVQPWWTKEPGAPLMKISLEAKLLCTTSAGADRLKQKTEITQRVANAKAKREAEEAAAMSGPVDPPTPENAPVPWLQWGGPTRDFRSPSTGLANRWPKGGPPKLWERKLGDGFSAILSDGDTLYTMYSIRDKTEPNSLKGDEVVVALDAKTGKTIWEHKYPAPWPKDLQMEFGPGPHSTPIVVGDRVFAIGCTAKLMCLDAKTGSEIWSKDLLKDYKAALDMRGYGSSPLAYKDKILLPVSHEKGHAVMAFNQSDGLVAWKAGDFEPGYASLLTVKADGNTQLIAFTGKALMGLDPENGQGKWKIDHPTQWGANISTPVWGAEDNHLFISSAYGMGARGVKLSSEGSQISAKEVWFNPKMKIQHADAVRDGDWIYGSSGDFGPTFLACVNAKTGEFGWRQRGIAKANVVYVDGKLIVFDEDGSLYLIKADAKKYRLLGKVANISKKTAWTIPTLVGRTLYVRDREKIIALDLSVPKGTM